jgi:predicted kinase
MTGELTVLIGLPGSGKTIYARKAILAAELVGRKMYRVNWDELRKSLGHTGAFDRTREETMKKISVNLVENAVRRGYGDGSYGDGHYTDVIIDNTNLTDSTRNMWRGVAERLGLTYVEHEMDADVRVAVQRDAERAGDAQVGRAVIERMALQAGKIYFPPTFGIGYKNIVIVDIDGTTADLEHRREIVAPKPCLVCSGVGIVPVFRHDPQRKCLSCYGTGKRKKDWHEFYKHITLDTPKREVIHLVESLRRQGYIILIVSGRPIRFLELEVGKETVTWLKDAGVIYEHIFMRQSGDKREDTIVKQEILDKLPKDRIAYVFDDRDSVVKMWRSNGLTCLQVAEGAF